MAIHKELIKSGSFDNKFKNALRDYYTYGFKSYNDFQLSDYTADDDWARLNNILFDYFEWSVKKSEAFFITTDSQSMSENPFHRVYRFCKYNSRDPVAFFNTICALSPNMELVEYDSEQMYETLDIDIKEQIEKRKRLQIIDYLIEHPTAEFEVRGRDKYLVSYSSSGEETDCLSILEKDEDFVETVIKFYNFFRQYTSCEIKKDMAGEICPIIEKAINSIMDNDPEDFATLPESINGMKIDWVYFIKKEFAGRFEITDNTISKTSKVGNKVPKVRKGCGDLFLCGSRGKTTHAIPIYPKDIDLVRTLLQSNGELISFRKTYFSEVRADLEDKFKKLKKDYSTREKLSSSQIQCFYPTDVALFTGENNTLKKKLEELKLYGVLVETDIAEDAKKKSERTWMLSKQMLNTILECGSAINPSFSKRLSNALDFFSKYSELGVVGNFIMSRIGEKRETSLRFKHEYYMQSLNDYNLIDLLYAIENNFWCKIEYRHAITGKQTTIACFPLEIRVSSTSGREYLAYYEPFSRSYSNLRIEFIDFIELIPDGKLIAPDGKAITLADEKIKSDICNATASLTYSWGASSTLVHSGNAISKAHIYDVWLRIDFDPDSESFIKNRLYREQRIGNVYVNEDEKYIDFTVQVTDVRELRPWIRSFYSRLRDYTGIDVLDFSVKEDLNKIIYTVEKKLVTDNLHISNVDSPENWGIPPGTKINTIPCFAHQSLFNELFSVYYHIIAEALMILYSSSKSNSFSETNLRDAIRQSIKKQGAAVGNQTQRLLTSELLSLLKSAPSFMHSDSTGYLSKYSTPKSSFYRDILPLTILECRWLLTIMHNPKMKLFLSEPEIEIIMQKLLATNPKLMPLPFHKIHYIDRFHIDEEVRKKEVVTMNELLTAIHEHKTVYLEYKSSKGKNQKGIYAPIVLEFSKRDNLFRGYFLSIWNKKISIMNIARIESINVLIEEFDYDKANNTLEGYRQKNMRKIRIEFFDDKNTADRILNEFSPWKKECVYERETRHYTLTIYYQKQDSFELVVRLLGYGSSIRIIEQDNRVFEQYVMRINKQYEIERKRNEEKAKKQSRNDDTKGI